MNKIPKPTSTSKNSPDPVTIHISPEGKVYVQKYDRDILELLSALNEHDTSLDAVIDSENRAVKFCG